MSSRLDSINWQKTYADLHYEILGCPDAAQKDLKKLWSNLHKVAMDVSKLEVTERRTTGSVGRAANEKFELLQKQIKYLEKMITIARLSF